MKRWNRNAGRALACALPLLCVHAAAAAASDGPRLAPDRADVAWMLGATAFALLTSVPALGLFYGGLVRSKNMLSVLMQVLIVFALVCVLWVAYGYSFAFTPGSGPLSPFVGGAGRLFLDGSFDPQAGRLAPAPGLGRSVCLPELLFATFEAAFAAIACCIVLGSIVERVRFAAVLVAVAIWFSVSYVPLAHMAWYAPGPEAVAADGDAVAAGLLRQWGVIDFAGGLVVHVNAGVAGLVAAALLGRRVGLGREAMPPHSLTMTMIGTALLWLGWIGFNAGSAFGADSTAALALLNTYLAPCVALLSWTAAEWLLKGRPSLLGAASGAVAGLVAIAPAAGTAGVCGSFAIGLLSGPLCLWGVTYLKRRIGIDDALDVFGLHALAGACGVLLAGVFAAPVPAASAPGAALAATALQLGIQAKAVALTAGWSAAGAWFAFKVADRLVGLRVREDEEREGLDATYHGESAYFY